MTTRSNVPPLDLHGAAFNRSEFYAAGRGLSSPIKSERMSRGQMQVEVGSSRSDPRWASSPTATSILGRLNQPGTTGAYRGLGLSVREERRLSARSIPNDDMGASLVSGRSGIQFGGHKESDFRFSFLPVEIWSRFVVYCLCVYCM